MPKKRSKQKRTPPSCPICLGNRVVLFQVPTDDPEVEPKVIKKSCFYCHGKGTINVQPSTLKKQHEQLLSAMEYAKAGDKDMMAFMLEQAGQYVPVPVNRRANILEAYT